jgi:phosphate acetyltransferase
MAQYPHLDRIIADAINLGPARVAVAYPCSVSSLEAAIAGHRLGLVTPTLVGPRSRIGQIAREKDIDLGHMEFREFALLPDRRMP